MVAAFCAPAPTSRPCTRGRMGCLAAVCGGVREHAGNALEGSLGGKQRGLWREVGSGAHMSIHALYALECACVCARADVYV